MTEKKEYLVKLEYDNYADERVNSPAKLIGVLCAFIEQLAKQGRISPTRVVIEEFEGKEESE